VVNSIRHYSLEAAPDPEVYAADRSMESAQFLVLRTRGRAGDLAGLVRKMVASLDPNVPVYLSAEMTALVSPRQRSPRVPSLHAEPPASIL